MHLVQLRGDECVVAMDGDYLPLTRTWCLAEVHYCLTAEISLSVSFGKHRPFPHARRGWGDINETKVSREPDSKVLRAILGDKGQPNALDEPSVTVKAAL